MLPEAEPPIDYTAEEISFELPDQDQVSSWLQHVATTEEAEIEALSYIFCSDEYLLQMNQEYLDHDTYTDVITFDYAEEEGIVEGDVFISVDRVRENAEQLNVPFLTELHRVMVHGLLHLLGYSDKTATDQEEMRDKEDFCLTLRPF